MFIIQAPKRVQKREEEINVLVRLCIGRIVCFNKICKLGFHVFCREHAVQLIIDAGDDQWVIALRLLRNVLIQQVVALAAS